MKTKHLKQRSWIQRSWIQYSWIFLFAAALGLSGCHKKVAPVAPPPPPAPAPAPAPTASITASPGAIQSGQSSVLSWTTANASQVSISGVGTVTASGSSSVSPNRSTNYTITATSAGGASVQATTRVTVTTPPPAVSAVPSMTEEEIFAQNVKDVYFDYDKYELRASDASTADQDASFLKSHPGMKVLIEGHCDDRGSEEYNLALGQNRAEELKKALIVDGVDASRVRVVSYGSEKPFCVEETDSCWQQNRRDHLKLDR